MPSNEQILAALARGTKEVSNDGPKSHRDRTHHHHDHAVVAINVILDKEAVFNYIIDQALRAKPSALPILAVKYQDIGFHAVAAAKAGHDNLIPFMVELYNAGANLANHWSFEGHPPRSTQYHADNYGAGYTVFKNAAEKAFLISQGHDPYPVIYQRTVTTQTLPKFTTFRQDSSPDPLPTTSTAEDSQELPTSLPTLRR